MIYRSRSSGPAQPHPAHPTIYRSRSSEGKHADTPIRPSPHPSPTPPSHPRFAGRGARKGNTPMPIRPSPHPSPTPPSPPHDLPVEVLGRETRRYADPPLTPPQPNPTQPTPPTTPFKIRTPTTPELRGWSFGLMGHHADVRRSIREIRRYVPLAVRGVTVYRWCLGAQLFWGRCLLALCILAQDRGSPPMEA